MIWTWVRPVQSRTCSLILFYKEMRWKTKLFWESRPAPLLGVSPSVGGCWVGVVIAVRLLILQPPDNPISSKCFPSLMAAAGKTMEGVVAILFGSWCPGILGVIPYPNFFKCICTSVFVPLCTLFLYLNFYTCICFFVFVSWH